MTLPEVTAAELVAELVGQHLSPRWLTEDCLRQIGGKVVANRAAITAVFTQLDGDPGRLEARDVVLRQQHPAGLSDAEVLDEDITRLTRELLDLRMMRARLTAASVVTFDPDQRDQDREDDRDRERRQVERADREAPRL